MGKHHDIFSLLSKYTKIILFQCYCADPTRCRFCHQEFQSLTKKSNHFRNTVHCNKQLKLFDITQMKQVSKTPKVHLLVPKQEQTNAKSADTSKVLDLSCGLCMDKFSGYISFYRHKVRHFLFYFLIDNFIIC